MSISRRALLALVPLAWAGSAMVALAAPIAFDVPLSGAQQVPPVTTSGTGTAHLTYNPTKREVTWDITYGGMSAPVTMAHFHQGAMGKNGPVKIWLTKKGAPVFAPITGNATLTPEEAQVFLAGGWYINVHTTAHPAGGIRGQVMPPKG